MKQFKYSKNLINVELNLLIENLNEWNPFITFYKLKFYFSDSNFQNFIWF